MKLRTQHRDGWGDVKKKIQFRFYFHRTCCIIYEGKGSLTVRRSF